MADETTAAPTQAATPQPATPPAPAATPAAAPVTPTAAPAATPPAAVAPKPFANPYAGIASAVAKRSEVAGAKMAEADAKVASLSAELEQQRAAVASFATRALSELPTDKDRAAVTKLAGDNPARQLEVIAALRETGHLTHGVPAPVSTSTAPIAQGAPVVNDPDTQLAKQYQSLKEKGSVLLRDQFFNRNRPAIERGLKKLSGAN